ASQSGDLASSGGEARVYHQRVAVRVDGEKRSFPLVGSGQRRPEIRAAPHHDARRIKDLSGRGKSVEGRLVMDRSAGQERADGADCGSTRNTDGYDPPLQRLMVFVFSPGNVEGPDGCDTGYRKRHGK